MSVSAPSTPNVIDRILESKQAVREPIVRIAGVDVVLDGQIDAHTAALLEPYSDAPGGNGKLLWSPEAFNAMVALCDSGGLQVSTHAAGDRAVRVALDGYEYARRTNDSHDTRFRSSRPNSSRHPDVPRFAHLNVVASMIPVDADPGLVDSWVRAVGPKG